MRDAAIRVLVMRGAGGKAFVAGTDIQQFQSFRDREDGIKYEERLDQVLDRLERVAKPTIAQIAGRRSRRRVRHCALLRSARGDTRIHVRDSRSRERWATACPARTYSRLVDVIGPVADEGRDVHRPVRAGGRSARDAAWSIASWMPIASKRRSMTLATEIAANAPLTIRATKEMIRRSPPSVVSRLVSDADLVELCYTSADFREGVTAFLEKRKPRWTGR